MVDTLLIRLDGVETVNPKEDFGIQIQFDQSIGAVFITFENDVTLASNGYEYLFNRYIGNGFCDRVEVDVVYACRGASAYLIGKGFILLSECLFNRDKCQVKTKIFDAGFQTRVNNNKSIQIYSNAPLTKNGSTITEPYATLPNAQRAGLFIPSTGVYTGSYAYGWSVYNAFEILTAFMSDNEIDFESNYFNTGEGKVYFVTSGQAIRNADFAPFKFSFEQLYTALNKKLQLGFGFQRTGGRTVLRIEDQDYFRDNAASITLLDVPGIFSRFDKERIFSQISLGSEQFLEEWQGGDANNEILSFPQVRFRGFKREEFGMCGDCNLDKTFDLVTRDVIFDSNIIENILVWQNQSFDENPVILQWEDYTGDAATLFSEDAQKQDIFGIDTFQYNRSLANEFQAVNNQDDLPCAIQNYYKEYLAADTVFAVENSGPVGLNDHEMRLSTQGYFYSDSTEPSVIPTDNQSFGSGHYLQFQTVNVDVGGNFVGATYIAPAPGIYTFTVNAHRIAPVNSPLNFTGSLINWQVVFKRMLQDQTVIHQYASPPTAPGDGTLDELKTFTSTFFCNQGDHVVVDVFASAVAYSTVGEAPFVSFFTNVTTTQDFSGDGVPLTGGQLLPSDPDYKAVIETFRVPLSFEQILALISDTTRSVAYSDGTDPLGVKRGDILKITIPAIGRNMADFELKTSTL